MEVVITIQKVSYNAQNLRNEQFSIIILYKWSDTYS